MKIRNKLSATFLLASVIPLMIVGLFAIANSHNALTEKISERSLQFAQLAAIRINEHIYSKYEDLRTWAENDEIIKSISSGDRREASVLFLSATGKTYGNYNYIYCADKGGVVVFSSDPKLLGKNFSGSEPFKNAVRGLPHIQDPQYDPLAKDYALTLSFPIQNIKKTEFIGVIVASLNWEFINGLNIGLKILGKDQDVKDHIMMTTKDGLVISCFDPKEMFNDNLIRLGMKSAKLAQDGKEGHLIEKSEHRLNSFSTYTFFKKYRDMPNLGWLVVYLQDPEKAFASVALLRKLFLMIMIITVALALAFAFKTADKISKPILALASFAQSLGKGKPEGDVAVSSDDEIGDLARSFNQMTRDLAESREKLLESVDYTNSIISSMADSLIVTNPDGTIKSVNEAAVRLLGYGEAGLAGRELKMIFPSEQNPIQSEKFQQLFHQGLLQNFEACYKTKDGRLIPVLLSGALLKNTGNGRAVAPDGRKTSGAVLLALDITERKKMEERIGQLNQALSELGVNYQENINRLVKSVAAVLNASCVMYHKLEGETLSLKASCSVQPVCNPIDQSEGHLCHELVRQKEPPFLAISHISQSRYAKTDVYVSQCKAKSYLGYQVKDGGRVVGAVCVIYPTEEMPPDSDVKLLGILASAIAAQEERERTQKQLIQSEKMAGVGTLAAGIAHEFNNSMQILRGNVELAQRSKDRQHLDEALAVALKISDKTKKITDGLLSFSQQQSIERRMYPVAEVVDSALCLVEGDFANCGIKIVREYKDSPKIMMNRSEMSAVFLNIAVNAKDAMLPKGEGVLTAGVRQSNGGVEISFSDTGEGIKEKNLPKLFEPFFTTKGALGGGKLGGTGLGLYVSYGVVRRHGGEIQVKSEEGRGATFTIKLPAGV